MTLYCATSLCYFRKFKIDLVTFQVVDWFENNDEDTITVKDLINIMNDFLPENEEPFSNTCMKKKLIDHYKNEIVFHEHFGQPTTVILQRRVETIVGEFYKQKRRETAEEEKYRIIITAAQLIRNDIIATETCEFERTYPKSTDMSSEKSWACSSKKFRNTAFSTIEWKN